MRVDDNVECRWNGESISCLSESVKQQWKHKMKSLVPVKEKHLYNSLHFFAYNKRNLMLKLHTYIEEANVT